MTTILKIKKAIYNFSAGLNLSGVSLMVLMTILIIIDIFMRFVFNKPFAATYELIEYAMVVVLSFAMAYTQVIRGHIDVSSIVEMFPKKVQTVFLWVANFIAFVYYGLMSWQTCVKGFIEIKSGTTSAVLYIIKWPFVIVCAFGFGIFALVLLTQLLVLKDPDDKNKKIEDASAA